MIKLLAFVMLIALCTAFSGHIVAIGETYLSVDEDTGDVYRVRERSRAYCDGTIVTRFRARRVASCAQSCNDSFSGCDSGYSSSCDNSFNGCDSGYSGCDRRARGPRFFRGFRTHRGFSGCDSGYSSSCDNSSRYDGCND